MWRKSERSRVDVDVENERTEWSECGENSKWSRVDVENDRAECMWTISEEDKFLLAFAKEFLKYNAYVDFVLYVVM